MTDSTEVRVPIPQRKGNIWFARVTIGDERIYISADSEDEYYAKARAAKSRQIEIKKAPPKLTLGKAIDNYIKDNDSTLSPSTINGYRSYRKTRFLSYIGMDVSQINYQRMINDEAKKVSPKTVHNAWRLVTASLAHANIPIPSVNLPQKAKPDKQWLDFEQIQTFCTALKGKPYELGALLALNGLRRSEILFLTAENIDTVKGIIHITGSSVIGADNKLIDKATNKTRLSSRDVHIVIPRITELVKNKSGRLITTNPTTLYGSINKLCLKCELPQPGVHGLRHSYVALCFHLGVSPDTVMREGGWSNLTTVNNVYRHLAAADACADITKIAQFYAQNT